MIIKKKSHSFANKNQTEQTETSQIVESEQTILQHFLALRKVLVISIIAVACGFVLSYYFLCDYIMDFITKPIVNRGIEIIYTAVSEAMITELKVSLVMGIILASPVIIWQIWVFIEPALYDHEKKAIKRWFFVALILFLIGVIFCYGSVYSLAVDFFLVAGEGLAEPLISIDKYISFLLSFAIPFGLAFELPIIILILTKLGLVTAQFLSSKRKYVILIVFFVAAVLTPPDVVSQIMLAVPMLVLFEVGVLIARVTKPNAGRDSRYSEQGM